MPRRRKQLARGVSLVCAALHVGLVALPAHAQTPAAAAAEPEANQGALTGARERYRAGAAAYADGRYKDAIDLFLEADKLRPSAALSFNIARAYEKLRDVAGALRWYRDYLRRANAPEDLTQVQSLIASLAEKLKEKGIQQVTVLSEPLGATVLLNRAPVGVTPWTGELAPGAHHLELRLRGYGDAARDFELPAATAIDVDIKLLLSASSGEGGANARGPGRVIGAGLAADSANAEPAIPLRTWGFISLGAAGAAFAGALTFELLRRSAEKDAENERVQTQFVEDVDRMESRRTTARIFAGVGAGLALAGGALVAVDLVNGKATSARHGRGFQLSCASTGCSAAWSRNF